MKANGGYFPFPNEVIDKLLCLLTGAEFKVLSVIIRQTLGWHKHWDRIAISQFRKKTGLSKPGVMNSLDVLLENDLILLDKVIEAGCLPENWYALFGDTNEADRLVKSVDQYSELTSQLILREVGNSVDQLGSKLVRSVYPQKKALKETIQKKAEKIEKPVVPTSYEEKKKLWEAKILEVHGVPHWDAKLLDSLVPYSAKIRAAFGGDCCHANIEDHQLVLMQLMAYNEADVLAVAGDRQTPGRTSEGVEWVLNAMEGK